MDEREDKQLSGKYKNFQQALSPFPSQKSSWEQLVDDGLPHLRVFEFTRRFKIDVVLTEINIPLMTLRAWEKFYSIPSPWAVNITRNSIRNVILRQYASFANGLPVI